MEMIYRFMYVNEGYEPCKVGFIYKNILDVKEFKKPMPDFIFSPQSEASDYTILSQIQSITHHLTLNRISDDF